MFGNKPKEDGQSGIQPDSWESNKLRGHIGKLIEDKLDALEKKLTRQMLCKHENYSVVERNLDPLTKIHLWQIDLAYNKICDDCGIDIGACGHKTKKQREYEIAKQKVEQFEESQLKEPEELPAEATKFRGNFSHIKKTHRINKAKYILQDALDEKERIDSGESDGTRTDCHNILFKAVEKALLELSKD